MGRPARFEIVKVAESDDEMCDFGPYVPSINELGDVAFQATLESGESSVFFWSSSRGLTCKKETIRHVQSHPAIDRLGRIAFYGELRSGERGLVELCATGSRLLQSATSPFRVIGPLGPTIHSDGRCPFRADLLSGESGIFVAVAGRVDMVADSRQFRAFHGLPVASRAGGVMFRAERSNGAHGIYLSQDGITLPVVETGEEWALLGLFPSVVGTGAVGFSGTRRGGQSGAFLIDSGTITSLVDSRALPGRIRGALFGEVSYVIMESEEGKVAVCAVASSDTMPILATGETFQDSIVVEFAANPVSINTRGELAVRVGLQNGRKLILKFCPVFEPAHSSRRCESPDPIEQPRQRTRVHGEG